MTPLTITSILLTALCFTACVGARLQAYTKADQPLFGVLRELERNPGNAQAQKDLPALYQQAVARHKAAIMSLSYRDNYGRVDAIAYESEIIEHINNAVRSIPAAFAIIKPVDDDDWSAIVAQYGNRWEIDQYWWNMYQSGLQECYENRQ